MRLHSDLLRQARFLARREPKRPSQASLRRAVSASYYSLFHFLVDEATKLLLSGRERLALRQCLARAFDHGTMKDVARQFSNSSVSEKLAQGYSGGQPCPHLVNFSEVFIELQQARHEADYALHRRLTRSEVLGLIDRADEAFEDWGRIRSRGQKDTFLVGLLAFKLMKG